jgi:hypothetical protein
MRFPLLAGLLLLTVSTAQVNAQYVNNKASTIGESWARGMSDVVRSAGDANLSNSAAAINYQEARTAELENRLNYTNTYFENKRLNKAYRAELASPRMSNEAIHRTAKDGLPRRLTASQLDPLTGRIQWPLALLDEIYVGSRAVLDASFAGRAENQGFRDYTAFSEVRHMGDRMLKTLKDNIRKYVPNDYLDAKRFVKSLVYEGRIPVGQ